MVVLRKNLTYKLVFNVGGKILTYTGKVISCEEGFVEFKDKYGDKFGYNLSSLISHEEMEEENK